MEQTSTGVDESTPNQERRELVRPTDGRIIAGVAKGIGDYLGIDEWIPRVVFIITVFTGGIGLALYGAGWAFIRAEDEHETPAERFFSGASGTRGWIGLGLIIVAAIIVLENFTILGGEVIVAGVLLTIGLLLYLGYLPPGRNSEPEEDSGAAAGSKEGVQRMISDQPTHTPSGSGVSPAGANPPPPTPPMIPSTKPREHSMLGRATLGFMALGLGILAILDNIDSMAIQARPYHYLALAVTILGIGLMVGSVWGRARWLILLSVVLVPTLLFSPFFSNSWTRETFDLRATPSTFEEIDGYQVDVGNLDIDLTELPWDGRDVVLDANVDVGNLEITVPEGVSIVGQATVDVGLVSEHPGRSSGGIGEPSLVWSEPQGDLGTLLLDAHVDLGNIDINRINR